MNDDNQPVTWQASGFYNPFKGLSLSDLRSMRNTVLGNLIAERNRASMPPAEQSGPKVREATQEDIRRMLY